MREKKKNQQGKTRNVAFTECLNVLLLIIFAYSLYLYFLCK